MQPWPARRHVMPVTAVWFLLVACGGSTAPAPKPSTASGQPAQTSGADLAGGAPAREPLALTVPYTPASGPMLPLWIAVEEGLFEKRGLKVTAEYVGGSSPIVQAMLSDQY